MITGMVTQIRKGSRTHLYIEEHMRAAGLNYEKLGLRLEVSATTMWRWAKEQWRLRPDKIDAIARALGLDDSTQLYRPPEPKRRPSIDAALADADDNTYDAVLSLAQRLTARNS